MTSVSRTTQFAKVQKVLKKYYKASPSNTGRTVVEHLLFACCLENAPRSAADEAFAALVHTFFDWNEVRVTSISELSEVMTCLPDSRATANRIKRVLHAIFEATFNFDLEDSRKKNLGPTVKWLEKLDGTTHFTVSYVVQAALGGHAIPIDAGTMSVLHILDLVTDKDVKNATVPGLERAVAKSKGLEFGSMLHEFGADYSANAYSPTLREILFQINPECEARLPKRRTNRSTRKQQEPPTRSKKTDEPSKTAADKKTSTRKKRSTTEDSPSSESPKKKSSTHRDAPKKPKKRPASEGLSKRKPR